MLRFLGFLGLVCYLASIPVTSYAETQDPKHSEYSIPENAEDNGFVSHEAFIADPLSVGDVSRFMFDGWTGPAIPVWAYVPTDVDVQTAPILFMMHGAKRNPARYLLEWAPYAQTHGFIVIAPEFSRKDFRGSRRYNRGNVSQVDGDDYLSVDESEWSFSTIEPLFDHVVKTLRSEQTGYTLYGHSAGSQFAHRFMFHKPEARVKRYLAANAGWYTMPDMSVDYPYGLKDSGVSQSTLESALSKPVLVLLGDQDVDMNSSSLNRTDGAMRQGEHRYNRGVTFMRIGKEQATKLGVDFGWKARRVEGVGHSNSGMAKAAAPYVK